MIPDLIRYVLLALLIYGVCLLTWAGFKQRRRGKTKSSRNLLLMAGLLAAGVAALTLARLMRSPGP